MLKLFRVLPLIACVLVLGACQNQKDGSGLTNEDRMAQAYERGDYELAYDIASDRWYGGSAKDRSYAQYIAGMSAWKLGNHERGARHLERVVDSLTPPRSDEDREDLGQVLVILGMIYAESGKHDLAADRFMRGAPYLSGEDQANGYFYAAASLQKLDRQPEAVTQFRLAKAATQDRQLKSEIDRRMQSAGFALQFGAFGDRANAQKLAEDIARKTRGMGFGVPMLVTAIDQRTGKTVTLVQLGLFTDYRSANQAKVQIGSAEAIIVQRNGRVGR